MKLGSVRAHGIDALVLAASEADVIFASDLVPHIRTIEDLLRNPDEGLASLQSAFAKGNAARTSIKRLHWLPPVPRPSKMLNVALNNRSIDEHLVYRANSPAFFSKPVSALQAHLGPIRIEPHYGVTHPEAELALIIGRGGRNIPLDRALDHVLGFTIANDITSVGMRREDRFHARVPLDAPEDGKTYREETLTYPARYKGCDTFAPVGPWIVTKDEVPDPDSLDMRCWVDDKLFFEDNTAHYTYGVAQIVFWMSAHLTLEPGDVISMGTAVNAKKKSVTLTSANLSQIGQTVTVEIQGIGRLENPIERVSTVDPRVVLMEGSTVPR